MLKVQCRCGHRVAVADSYAGKRVKCPKCQGPLAIPSPQLAGVAAASGQASRRPVGSPPVHVSRAAAMAVPVEDDSVSEKRVIRARRHALERKRKSHNTTVALIAGAMVVVGLGVMLYIGINHKPEPVVIVEGDTSKPKAAARESASTGLPRTISMNKSAATAVGETQSSNDAETPTSDAGDDSVTIAGQRFTAGSSGAVPVASTATFDAGGNVTTIKSQPTPILVGDKTLQMTVTVTHDGKKVQEALTLDAVIHVQGDFTGLASAGVPDEPRLTIEADAREFFLPPSKRDESDTRKKENGPEILPTWVEYALGRAELLTIATGKDLRITLGGTLFTLSPEQVALFQSFAPAAPPVNPQEKPLPEVEGSTPPGAAAGEDAIEPNAGADDQELMDKKEMMKKEMMDKK